MRRFVLCNFASFFIAGHMQDSVAMHSQYPYKHRVPTVMEKHGKNLVMEKSWKMGEKIKSWKFKKVMEFLHCL